MTLHLVVGNQTLGSLELRAVLEQRASNSDARIHLVVPQTPLDHYQLPIDGHVQTVAEHQLVAALDDFSDLGIPVTGEIGDARPLEAVLEVALRQPPTEVIVSTFPPGASRWLGADLPTRIERKLGVPVHHVTAHRWDADKRADRRYREVRDQLGLT